MVIGIDTSAWFARPSRCLTPVPTGRASHRSRARRSAARTRILGTVLLLGILGCRTEAVPDRILLIVVDTLRADVLGPYGGEVATPVIESVAERGQVFSNAVASFHQTPMSMSAMFTGLTPSIETGDPARPLGMNGRTSCGLTRFDGMSGRRGCIPPSVETLGEVMKGAGYSTMGIVSNGLLFAPFGLQSGFDDWVEVGIGFLPPGKVDAEKRLRVWKSHDADAVNSAVQRVLRGRSGDRFLLYVHYMDAHDYAETLDWGREYREKIPVVDRAIGRLLGMLEAENLLDGTVIVLTSDHGERLHEKHFVPGTISHGGNPAFEEVLRIPLIVAPPRFDDTRSLVRTQDIFGLITRIAGLEPQRHDELESDEVYLSENEWQTYRRGRWKSFVRRSEGTLFLVDLATDSGETRDVSPDHLAVVEAHRERISVLSRNLAASHPVSGDLTPEDEGRLRALGYLE